MMEHPNDQVSQMQPLDELYWRDEISQVMYWYQGEGFGESVTVRDLQTFLPADEHLLATQMDSMVTEGYLVRGEGDASLPRYAFTAYGASEGASRGRSTCWNRRCRIWRRGPSNSARTSWPTCT